MKLKYLGLPKTEKSWPFLHPIHQGWITHTFTLHSNTALVRLPLSLHFFMRSLLHPQGMNEKRAWRSDRAPSSPLCHHVLSVLLFIPPPTFYSHSGTLAKIPNWPLPFSLYHSASLRPSTCLSFALSSSHSLLFFLSAPVLVGHKHTQNGAQRLTHLSRLPKHTHTTITSVLVSNLRRKMRRHKNT